MHAIPAIFEERPMVLASIAGAVIVSLAAIVRTQGPGSHGVRSTGEEPASPPVERVGELWRTGTSSRPLSDRQARDIADAARDGDPVVRGWGLALASHRASVDRDFRSRYGEEVGRAVVRSLGDEEVFVRGAARQASIRLERTPELLRVTAGARVPRAGAGR